MSATDLRLARLLQLASPALPVGAYSYSQGLEAALEAGVIRDAHTAGIWIGDVLDHTVARTEAPILLRLIAAWRAQDVDAVRRWNDIFLASRETAELRAETVQMGYSLNRLLADLLQDPRPVSIAEISFPAAFAYAVATWDIDAEPALTAYLWAWLENQVMAAVKAVPLGQTDGQRLLLSLAERLPRVAADAAVIADDDLGGFAPRFALLSSKHETQYSRLFRS
jgi:urease accessory protein